MKINENEIVKETDEILEKFNEAEQALVDEMIKKGEVVMHDFKEETQKRGRFGNKLVLAAGLGLAVYAGYTIYKTIVKHKGTQSEVIVEEENIEE